MTTHPDLTTAAAYLDEAMKAIALAKQALLGGAGGALFVSSGPDLAAAEASPGGTYGSTPLASLRDREHYDAGSAAGGVDDAAFAAMHTPLREVFTEPAKPCGAHSEPQYVQDPASYFTCELPAGHGGEHAVFEADGEPALIWGQQDAGSAAGVAEGVEPKVVDAGLNCGDCGCGLGLHNLAGTHCNFHGAACDPGVMPVPRMLTLPATAEPHGGAR